MGLSLLAKYGFEKRVRFLDPCTVVLGGHPLLRQENKRSATSDPWRRRWSVDARFIARNVSQLTFATLYPLRERHIQRKQKHFSMVLRGRLKPTVFCLMVFCPPKTRYFTILHSQLFARGFSLSLNAKRRAYNGINCQNSQRPRKKKLEW